MGNIGGQSRQRAWQDAHREQGLCIQCGEEPLINKNHGYNCAKKIRERARKRTGATKRYKGAASYQRSVA
jgi:hypothetical protein